MKRSYFLVQSFLVILMAGISYPSFGQLGGASSVLSTASSMLSSVGLDLNGKKSNDNKSSFKKEKRKLDIATPQGSVNQFLDFARSGEYEHASEFINFRKKKMTDEEKRTFTRQFITVLDQMLVIDIDELSDSRRGKSKDGLRKYVDQVGIIEYESGYIPILVERAWRKSGYYWRVTNRSFKAVTALYDDISYNRYLEYLPQFVKESIYFGIYLWQWVSLFLLLPLAFLVSIFIFWGFKYITIFAIKRADAGDSLHLIEIINNASYILRWIFFLTFYYGLILSIGLPIYAEIYIKKLAICAGVLIISWVFYGFINRFSLKLSENLYIQGNKVALSMLPLARRTSKIIIGFFAVLLVLQNLGIDVTTLLAGLGIGGLVLALAAQKTIEHFIGGITLVFDRPVRVGDFCRFDSFKGVVEDVGIRSTRIRTLDRTLISIPNADFSQMKIENYSRRERIRLHTILGVRYETSKDQLRYLLKEIREMLSAHPKIDNDPPRVRFIEFGAYSLNIEIHAYVLTDTYSDYLAIKEEVF